MIRQLRINSLPLIRKRLPEFIGKKINIVLNDRTVILVTITGVNEDELTVRNMRNRVSRLPVDTISEIYFDTKE